MFLKKIPMGLWNLKKLSSGEQHMINMKIEMNLRFKVVAKGKFGRRISIRLLEFIMFDFLFYRIQMAADIH